MSLEIDFDNQERYVLATVTGTFTKESALPLFEKLLIYCTVTKSYRLLIDCRKIEGELPIKELFAFSEKSNKIRDDYEGMIKDLRSAYVFNPEHHNLDHIQQGVYDKEKDDFILTLDFNEAVKWLASR